MFHVVSGVIGATYFLRFIPPKKTYVMLRFWTLQKLWDLIKRIKIFTVTYAISILLYARETLVL